MIGRRLDKYELLEEVGHGGMAVVYRGHDTNLDREVAVKILHPHLADRSESRQRLHREAITVAKLKHPSIVEIFDYSNEDVGPSYIVTEFIHGVTLRSWMDTRWQPRPALAVLVVYRICLALEHAHRIGVVHRDIKPENVMIRQDGCLKLMDFGIAQLLDHQKLTMTGQLLGSPAYMAPEIISGQPIDARTDLFALGILLYQLATGSLPFSGRNPHEVLSRIAAAEYTLPSTINPCIDAQLEEIIATALARAPGDRYQSASAFAKDLQSYLADLKISNQSSETEAYFQDPEKYVRELDQRICCELLEQGANAAREGQNARALRLLGRVLELDPKNEGANSLLNTVKIRGRRTRQVMTVIASLAGIGIVAAASILMQQAQSEPINRLNKPEHSQYEAQSNASSSKASLSSIEAQTQTTSTLPTSSGEAKSTQNQVQPPIGDKSILMAGPTSDRLKATNDHEDSNRNRPHRTRPNRPLEPRATESNPQSSRTSVPCRLRVGGLPIPSRGHFAILGPSIHKRVPANEAQTIPIEVPPQGILLTLTSANSEQSSPYEGSLRIQPRDCMEDQAPPVLIAKPRPASLRFLAKNFPIETLTVRCVRNCDPSYQKIRTAKNFRNLKIDPGKLEQIVTLEFKAGGYRTLRKEFTLQPGTNQLTIELEPL